MFTGLVQSIGSFDYLKEIRHHFELKIQHSLPTVELQIGESIAIDGACLSLTAYDTKALFFEVSKESYNKTLFRCKKQGDAVNIEFALSLKDKLGGHLCQGHVEDFAQVEKIILQDATKEIVFSFPEKYAGLIVEKGSILISGVSLTTFDIQQNTFKSALIPITLRTTNLDTLKLQDLVHMETDMIARYVQNLISPYIPKE